VIFSFHGRTAHAAGDPYNGRSALDAVELMNIGVNYLREHVDPSARIHYTIINGGGEPNVVPAEAESWYYIRAPRRTIVEEIYQRILKIAEGAALMTETTFDAEFLDGTYNLLYNDTVGQVLHSKLVEVGPPPFDSEDQEFADKISESFPASYREAHINILPDHLTEYKKALEGKSLCDVVLPIHGHGEIRFGSTDVADVSWFVPTAQFRMATQAIGTPGHSWQLAASAGMSVGHKGLLTAAKALGLAALEFMENPSLVEAAQKEFAQKTAGNPYVCPLPEGLLPPFHRLG